MKFHNGYFTSLFHRPEYPDARIWDSIVAHSEVKDGTTKPESQTCDAYSERIPRFARRGSLFPVPSLYSFHTTRAISPEGLLLQEGLNAMPRIELTQIHSANGMYVTGHSPKKIADTDAVYTDQPHLMLSIRTADCLPILLYHPKGIIGAIHAGRKGTLSGITQATLKRIQDQFKIDKDFMFWFGPAICKGCYQIDREKKVYFDLIDENENQIKEILENRYTIHFSQLCTSCRNDLFYSYRKEGEKAGRQYTLIALR